MTKYKSEIFFVCGLIVGLALGYSFAPQTVKGKMPVEVRSSIVGQPGEKIVDVTDKSKGDATSIVECPGAITRWLDGRASYIPWPGWPGMCLRTSKP